MWANDPPGVMSSTLTSRAWGHEMVQFGIFDHIEGMPGTDMGQLLRDRLELIKVADQAGFYAYHLAEHHGTDLCMAPNQESSWPPPPG